MGKWGETPRWPCPRLTLWAAAFLAALMSAPRTLRVPAPSVSASAAEALWLADLEARARWAVALDAARREVDAAGLPPMWLGADGIVHIGARGGTR